MEIMTILVISCAGVAVGIGLWLLAAILYSLSDLQTFYFRLPVNMLAFVTKGGKVVRVIYNSVNMKLVYDRSCPLGKFVLKTEPGQDLQQLGPVEKLLGLRWIGLPYIHSLLGEKHSWWSVNGSKFTEHKDEVIYTLKITNTFGFKLKDLALGWDSDKITAGRKRKGQNQEVERILVNILLILQATIRDPHLAFIATDWMASVEGKLMRFVQAYLGHTNQDELIEMKAGVDANGVKKPYCDLVQELIDNLGEIQDFGVDFEEKRITYVDYELGGDPDNAKRIQAANTTLFEKNKEAAGIRAVKAAKQADAAELQRITLDYDDKLKRRGYSEEARRLMVADFLKANAMDKTGLTTWVEGGGQTVTAITAGGPKTK